MLLRARYLHCALGGALALASCAEPSRLDRSVASAASDDAARPAGDPWSTPAEAAGKTGKPGKPGKPGNSDGMNLEGMLGRISESVGKPGPYEAPQSSSGYQAGKPHWGVLGLSGSIVERQALSWSGGSGTELRALVDRLRGLATDAALTGIVLRTDGFAVSLPDVIELRAAIHDLRAAGKRVACHAENAQDSGYLALAACDRLALAPLGGVLVTGAAAMPVHVKPLLDKLGIRADFLHVGAYKGAAEPLTRDAPSKEMEETLGAILDRRYQTMVDVIAAERKLPPAKVQALIDTAMFTSDQAKDAGLVDDVAAFEAFRDGVVGAAPWTKITLDPEASSQLSMMLKVSRFLGALPPERPVGDHVAVVYALGSIVDGEGDGVLGARQEIASHTLVAALRALTADTAVKAVVLRIDSGGGSAQASELIWRAVAELKAKKPVVVSMSDVAASGGYYIAAGATKIFALDDTLTGSIGVVGGKLAPRDALDKLGVRTYPMGRGKRATMAANLGPWSDDERAAVQGMMEAVYKVFVGRVAEGRHMTPDAVHAIAQGRVWTGAKAKQLGLVDELGGFDAALAAARALGHVADDAGLELYPPAPTLRDVLAGLGQVQAPFGLTSRAADAALVALAPLRAADPAVGAAAEHLVKLVLSFRSSMIQAVAILPVMP